jgi:hypothetical protein
MKTMQKLFHPFNVICISIPFVTAAIGLLFPGVLPAQTTHTWIGDDVGSWNVSTNWSSNAVPVNNDSLIFTGDYIYTFNDLTSTVLLRHITFAENAGGPFEVDGNAFNIGGTMTNNSDYEVTIWNGFGIRTGGGAIPYSRNGTYEGLIIDVGHAGITLAGAVATDQWSRHLVKQGAGTLTVSNTGSIASNHIMVMDGTLHVDGGEIMAYDHQNKATGLGSGWAADAPETFASATLLFTNNAVATFGPPSLMFYSGMNLVKVESGSVVELAPATFTNLWPPVPGVDDSGRRPEMATMHYDLTQQGTGGVYAGSVGIFAYHVVVSVDTVNGVKTGFGYRAAWDAELEEPPTKVEIATPYLTEYTGGALSAYQDHRRLNGSVDTGQASITIGALTLTGAGGGVLRRNETQVGTVTVSGFLMEEGTGDYLIDLTWNISNSGTFSTRYIHQYSTDGTLTFGRALAQNTTNRPHLVKTGPGTVIFIAGANLANPGQIEIQGGRFELNSVAGRTSYVRSRGAGSVLAGSGSIGGGDFNGSPRYTAVQVFDGGTLEADYHNAKALDITGSLTLLGDGHYSVALHADPLGDPLTVLGTTGDTPQAAEVSLAGNLILSLHYDYVASEDPIILLRTDGLISGAFDTINNSSFINGNQFTLTFDTNDYWFQIDYAYDLGGGFTAVALYAIPEPATVALLVGLALTGGVMVWRRRIAP